MEELRNKLNTQLYVIAKNKMSAKDYDEMESIESILKLNIPDLDVSLIRELIDAQFNLQKQILSNRKVIEAANRSMMHSNIVDFSNDLNKAQSAVDMANSYYENLLDTAVKSLKTKEK